MSLDKELKNDFGRLSNASVIVIALCASLLLFLFTYLGDPGKGRAAAICAGLILMCAKMFWNLRRQVLFWVAMLIVTCYHIPLITSISWGNRDYPGIVLLPFALPDLAITYGLFKLAEKLTKRGTNVTDSSTGV